MKAGQNMETEGIMTEEIKSEMKVSQVNNMSNPLKVRLRRDIINVWAVSQKVSNKRIKIINGNGNKKLLKIVNWNLGSRRWHNKVDEVTAMVLDYNPDVAVISEANLKVEVDQHMNYIPGYNIITVADFEVEGLSRLVVLTKEGLEYKILREKMEPEVASIWLSFTRKGRKPFVFGAVYREHRIIQGPNQNNVRVGQQGQNVGQQGQNVGQNVGQQGQNAGQQGRDNRDRMRDKMWDKMRDNRDRMQDKQTLQGTHVYRGADGTNL